MKEIIKNSTFIRFAILILLVVLLFVLGNTFSIDHKKINDLLRRISPLYASLIFVFLYVVGTFFIWYLKDPLKIIGAVLFGAYLSTFLIYIAEIINAIIFFNLSNMLGRDFVEQKLKGKFRKFYERLGDVNLGWIFLLRFIPLIPYRVLDLSFGLSKVPLKRYIIAVLLASPLRIFWIQAILASIKGFSPQKVTQYFVEHPGVYIFSFFYFVVALIVAFKMKKKFL